MSGYSSDEKKCRICGNTSHNVMYDVKERQLNRGESFPYLYCGQCGTLQLVETVEDVGQYYADNYYSFQVRSSQRRGLPMVIKKCCAAFVTKCSFWLPAALENFLREYAGSLMTLYGTKLKLSSSILDVGGGNGRWLNALSQWGFRNLTCIDLFCKESPFKSIDFKQCDIKDLDAAAKYDCITFNHSFEHMPDPEPVLRKVRELLSADGVCLIRIPVCECAAWDKYKENWYQIDAPRHYYLYTERAMRDLCSKLDLKITKVIFDSGLTQFINSEYYQNTDLSLKEVQEKARLEKAGEKKSFKKTRNRLNKTGKGDQAAFYIRHLSNGDSGNE